MPDALDDAADDVRARLGIPPVGASENGSATRDGWYVTGHGARFIGLIRRHRDDDGVSRPALLARRVVERLEDERLRGLVTRSFELMETAHHHVGDPALVLALTAREASVRGGITRSYRYRDTYRQGGADDAWGLQDRLPLPPIVRRRLQPVRGYSENEAGRRVQPARVRGRDQVVLYAAYILRAQSQLRAQVRRTFPEDGEERMSSWSDDARRAWTQLSFGRGGGGGLLRALERARDRGATLESIFTDPGMVEADSVKRARVTAGDAALIQRFALRGSPFAAGRPSSGVRP